MFRPLIRPQVGFFKSGRQTIQTSIQDKKNSLNMPAVPLYIYLRDHHGEESLRTSYIMFFLPKKLHRVHLYYDITRKN